MAAIWDDLGPCEVTFDSEVLGKTVANPAGGTHGGTRLRIETSTQETFRDAEGDDPYDEIITGQRVTVETNLTGLSIEQLAKVIPGATLGAGTATKDLKLTNPVGTSMRANAAALILKPIIEGTVTTDENLWVTLDHAYPQPNIDLAFSLADQKVYNVVFKTFRDATTGSHGTIAENTSE